jgi:protein tyrosine phosphatase (PTP) superfamily phosphohydrolase (DUF442 family)
MNNSWGILCVTLLASTQMALGDGDNSGSQPALPAATNARTRLLAEWPASDAPVRRIKEKGVPNFGMLNKYVWRSGQPTREGYQRLAAEGLKTVVNLRAESQQDKDLLPPGVRYIYIPIKDEHAPTDEQAKQFLDAAADPANWPILVHCAGGEGRAGVMSALVRYSFDGWDHDRVMKEMHNFRNKHLGFIVMPMAGSQQHFIQHWEVTNSARGYLAASVTSQAVGSGE